MSFLIVIAFIIALIVLGLHFSLTNNVKGLYSLMGLSILLAMFPI